MNDKNVLFMAGGTGGHVNPGIAVAKELEKRGYQIHWLGTRTGIEARLVPASGFSLHFLRVKGVRGRGLMKKILAPLSMFMAVVQAIKIIRKVRPKFVVGFGGYVAAPGGVAAYLLRLPLIVHEQNAVAGATNKILSKFADKVLIAFPTTMPKGVVTGNPVREEMRQVPPPSVRFENRTGALRVLVFGGSLGASGINKIVPKSLGLARSEIDLIVKHQTGKNDVLLVQDEYEKSGQNIEVLEFIDDMAGALEWADFVICRSGALTVSEMATVGLGAIYIPFPYAVDDHQTKNAEYICHAGGGYILQESDAEPGVLAKLIIESFSDRKKLLDMATKAMSRAVPDTEKIVANMCEDLIHV